MPIHGKPQGLGSSSIQSNTNNPPQGISGGAVPILTEGALVQTGTLTTLVQTGTLSALVQTGV